MTIKEQILEEIKDINYAYNDCSKYATIKNLLDEMAEERKKGKWILSDEQREEDVSNGNYQFYCSECGHGDLQSKSVTVSFCWNCGARMNYEETDDAEIH